MSSNSNLNKAKNAKHDEFYTPLTAIESELSHYTEHFANKVVLCNCNDAIYGGFKEYFLSNFESLGLKKLICTAYMGNNGNGISYVYNDGYGTNDEIYELNGPGDFRSDDMISLLKQSDIVVTNPPFSCYSTDTEVLTKNGWKWIKDITTNDVLISMNPETNNVEYSSVVRLYKNKVNEKLYHFKKRGIDLLVTSNHRMICNQSETLFKRADEIKGEYHTMPIKNFNYIDGDEVEHFVLPSVTQKEQYSRKEIIVDEKLINMGDWLEFFGFWLADGCVRNGLNSGGHPRYIVSIKQNIKNEEYVQRLCNNIGFECKVYKRKDGNNNYEVYSKQLWNYLKQFGGSTEKYIPREFLNLNKNLLKRLLDGYLKGDSNGDKKQMHIGSVSKKLCENLQELILKVDGRIINFLPKKSKGNDYWAASFSLRNLSRNNVKYPKPNLIDYNDYVYCAELEKNHTMLVRRNGVTCWCGNCFREFITQLISYGKKFLIIGNMNAITYNEVFPYIMNNSVWLGTQYVKAFSKNGETNTRFGNILWYTNLDNKNRHSNIPLTCKYNPNVYQTYDNCDAIEVSQTKFIPMDYDGIMGVPISFLGKYNPSQFRIVGRINNPVLNGKTIYKRLLIQKV